jgi:hypothetical protein
VTCIHSWKSCSNMNFLFAIPFSHCGFWLPMFSSLEIPYLHINCMRLEIDAIFETIDRLYCYWESTIFLDFWNSLFGKTEASRLLLLLDFISFNQTESCGFWPPLSCHIFSPVTARNESFFTSWEKKNPNPILLTPLTFMV